MALLDKRGASVLGTAPRDLRGPPTAFHPGQCLGSCPEGQGEMCWLYDFGQGLYLPGPQLLHQSSEGNVPDRPRASTNSETSWRLPLPWNLGPSLGCQVGVWPWCEL